MNVDLGQTRDLATALAIGLLIGVERGWSERDAPPGSRVAGIRTFGLLGLLGGVAVALSDMPGSLFAATLIGGAVLLLGMGYWLDAEREKNLSATTGITAVLTIALGGLAVTGHRQEAAAAAVVTAILLSLREGLHGWLASLSSTELKASLRFLLLTVVVLPLLPDRPMGPYGALNPYELGVIVILLSGLSFAGYWAMRYLGTRRGLLITAAAGGLASSTAVTFSMSRLAKAQPEYAPVFAAAVIIASLVMILRVLILSIFFAPDLLPFLLPALLTGFAVGGTVLLAFMRRKAKDVVEAKPVISNPFELRPALGFTALLAVLLVVSRYARDRAGDSGVFAVTAITGLVDVDSVVISIGRLLVEGYPSPTGARAVLIAVGVDTLSKILIPLLIGAGSIVKTLAVTMVAIVLAGLLAYLVQHSLALG